MPGAALATSDAYVARTLAIIRVANGLTRTNAAEQRALAADIRMILAGRLNGATRRELVAALREVAAAIAARYADILERQRTASAALIRTEATWAAATSQFVRPVSAAGLEAAGRELLVFGSTLEDHWQRMAGEVQFRVRAQIRAGVAAGQSEAEIVARVVGDGARGSERGGVLDIARRNAAAMTEAGALASAHAGRLAAMKANGVNALRWHAVLDPRVCPSCGERAGKLWTIEGQPIAHAIPLQMPPIHPNCRCIATPMKYPEGPPANGGPDRDKFEHWLERQSPARQENVLGKGRADLWRRGQITTADLIGQGGLVMPLRDLPDAGT